MGSLPHANYVICSYCYVPTKASPCIASPSTASSSIDTLRVRINLHTLLGHLGVLQKVQRHPDEVALDLVEFLADLVRGHEGVVEMALLVFVVFGEEGLVVGEGFD